MKVFKIVTLTILSLAFLAGASFFLIGYLKPQPGGILVDSTPSSNVYINGKYVDKTPYKNTFESGEVTVKLVPDGLNIDPYEVVVDLSSGAQTVVNYKFSDNPNELSGYVLSFEKDPNKETGIIVASEPDNAQVFIDGTVRGFAPVKAGSLSPGKHQISIKLADYQDQNLAVTLYEGFILNANIKLAKAPEPTPSPEPTPDTRIFVEILDTPTGFLRVRTEAGTKGEEIAEVKPGEKYLLLEEDSSTGWYKIQYSEPKAGLPDGIQGWVSNQYSKKVEN